MRIILLSIAILLSFTGAWAQGDTSLTKEFGHLSAKERARLAKQEQEGSANDEEYQRIMAEAEDLFRRKEYDESLVRFQEARQRRPLNVYPKVKIQDLQALIAKREAERIAEAGPPQATEVPTQGPIAISPEMKDTVAAPVEPVPLVVKPVPKAAPIDPETPRPVKVVPKAVPAVVGSAQDSAKVVGPDGMVERMYMEGRAVVLERTVTTNGHALVFRKVTHPWGQVNYFRDGIAVSERAWQEAAAGR